MGSKRNRAGWIVAGTAMATAMAGLFGAGLGGDGHARAFSVR